MQACVCRSIKSKASSVARLSLRSQARTAANLARLAPASTSGGSANVDGALIKTFKPITPSLRHVKQIVHPHLHKGKPERKLTEAKRATGGRNNTGKIATRFRGGGHKRRIRIVDFKRTIEGAQTVERIEYDPGRSAHIALLVHDESKEVSYILAPDGLRAGDKVQAWPNGVSNQPSTSSSVPSIAGPVSSAYTAQPQSLQTALLRASMLKTGNLLPLSLLPPGTTVHCISTRPTSKGALCRSAGTFAKIVATESSGSKGAQYAQIQLQSGEVRKLHRDCTATIGVVSNKEHQMEQIGKAGRNRWLGKKPHVRGMAMNATDHPHGGGRGKSKGNKHPRTPQGLLTKGRRTRRPGPTGNRNVVRQRPRGKEAVVSRG